MYISIDLGGTNLKVGVINDDGKILYLKYLPTKATEGKDYIINNIKKQIDNALKKFPNSQSIGIGVPGIVDNQGIVKVAPNLIGWKNVPIKNILSSTYNKPVAVDNDANTAALAELELGNGKDCRNFIYLTLGTGVGGAIVINREIFRGDFGGAGEIGHLIIDSNSNLNHEKPYRTGILEEFIGKNQITDFAKNYIKDKPESILHLYDKTDPYFITEAIKNNDKAAIEIFRNVGYYLGIGLTNVMNLLDIRLIIIGGGLSLSHPLLFDYAKETISKRAMPSIAEHFEIRKAKFLKDAGIIGAGLLGKRLLRNNS